MINVIFKITIIIFQTITYSVMPHSGRFRLSLQSICDVLLLRGILWKLVTTKVISLLETTTASFILYEVVNYIS
jgi:hypothetical protein